VPEVDLAHFVSSLDSFEKIANVHDELAAMGGGLTAALVDEIQRLDFDIPANGKPATLLVLLPHGASGSRITSPTMPSPTRPRNWEATKTAAKKSPADAPTPPPVVEQIQVKREATIVLRAQQETSGKDIQDGVHTLFFDLGDKPKFWPLVGEFLRE
jgi:hypothetical protein